MATASWQQLMQNAEEGGVSFEPLPVGEYLVEVNSAEYKPAASGKDMWVLKFKVLSGPYANRTVFHNLVLTQDNPNALSYFFRHMKALGLDKGFFAAEPQPSQVAMAMEGRTCRIKVKQREYPKGSGEMRNDVDGIFAADGAQVPQQAQAPQQPGVPQMPQPQVPQPQPQVQAPVQQPQPQVAAPAEQAPVQQQVAPPAAPIQPPAAPQW